LLIDEVGDDGLTKDADEDEVGNLVDDNCCGIDANDGKLVGVVGVVALATDGVVVVAAGAAVVIGGGMPNFLTNKITKLKNK